MDFKNKNYWALILGGSSGIGLATAKKLSRHGMNLCIAHRDRKGSMAKIEADFNEIRNNGAELITLNLDALCALGREQIIRTLTEKMSPNGKVRLLLHSIAFGNLKLIAPLPKKSSNLQVDATYGGLDLLAKALGNIPKDKVQDAVNQAFSDGANELLYLSNLNEYNEDLFLEEEDMANTISAMGTSLLTWSRELFNQNLFALDARVIGLTSQGNQISWRSYAAVSAAKAALESISKSIAYEFAPYGIRSNIVQAGVTETPALKLIPGSAKIVAQMKLKNPSGRLTRPEDVANVIALLATDEAAWINGALIVADGGERIAG